MENRNWHIRRSEFNDIAQIRAIYAQASCYSGTLQLPFPSQQLWEKKLGQVTPGFYSLVAERDERILGQLGMMVHDNPRRKHVANLGLGVCESARGLGVGKALMQAAMDLAFNWLAIKRIEIEVYTDNQAAIALYQSLGFELEGRAKGYAFRNGEYVDVELMAKTVGL
ncbi:GNAT family N-acetyltransferase [Shewanella submarina]|uniref:GNAT family N-acetyltransferase n=1 Tax=Shewanella submarina TaxID=2016376 RepID=A0ABV7G8N0_9GAMM|nr:GNAT family N-acetyltransferase [Shewanella submarina]MCL1036745.1 GNAT family N-acetyltransferase [Shewanella submarina]